MLPLLALGIVLLLAYSNSLRSAFVMDNAPIILEDPRVHAVTTHNLEMIRNGGYWYKGTDTTLYRPLATLSYLFDYAILGNRDRSAGYHWINLMMHMLNALLVYLVSLAVLQNISRAQAVAALWAVHPLLTESVTNIVGRADLLAAMGVLGGLLCQTHANRINGWRRGAWLAGLAAASTVAIFAKESGIVLIVVIFVYDLATTGRQWRTAVAGYVATAIPAAWFLLVRAQYVSRSSPAEIPYIANPLLMVDFWQWHLTAFKVIGKYLLLFVWPAILSCDYSFDQIPISHDLRDWPALFSRALCAAAAFVAVCSLRRRVPVFFFVSFFFVALAPVSNMVLRIGTIMAERLLYLPAVGLAGCVV